jgi:hypothetical protein
MTDSENKKVAAYHIVIKINIINFNYETLLRQKNDNRNNTVARSKYLGSQTETFLSFITFKTC